MGSEARMTLARNVAAHHKLHTHWSVEGHATWRKRLGAVLESAWVTGPVLLLTLTDLFSLVLSTVLEETDLLNPKYAREGEVTERVVTAVSRAVLGLFEVEMALYLVAFGRAFFRKPCFVVDLVVVLGCQVAEVFPRDWLSQFAAFAIAARLWKLVAFLYDVFELAQPPSTAEGGSQDPQGESAAPSERSALAPKKAAAAAAAVSQFAV